jgi:hypothetical protein
MHACKADVERIPDELHPLFRDCDFDSLQWPTDRDFIITHVSVYQSVTSPAKTRFSLIIQPFEK